MEYSIDTSSILEGWVRNYPIDAFPGVWDKLDNLIDSGDLRAIQEVYFELEKKEDEVFEWVKNRPNLFVPIDLEIQSVVLNITSNFPNFVDYRKERPEADCFVIALAQQNGATVITEEHPSTNPQKPKMPDICRAMNIPSINLLGLIREKGWIFRTS
jgi:hypothetical protein